MGQEKKHAYYYYYCDEIESIISKMTTKTIIDFVIASASSRLVVAT